MRTFVVISLLALSMVSAKSQAAQTDPMAEPNAEMSAESEALMAFQEMQSRLEHAGYRDLQLSSDGLSIRARNRTNQSVVIRIDDDALLNLPVELVKVESSTTGSGSAQELRR